LELQAKLLRVLQDGEFERLGNPKTLRTDARVITATNRNLEEEVRNGRFRKDLWYRLNIFPINVPPLRLRKDDIPPLVQWFVNKYTAKTGKQIESIHKKTMLALQRYDWPGNIRELENLIERAIITAQNRVLEVDLPENSCPIIKEDKTLEEVEREYIINVLEKTKWKISGPGSASMIIGIHPNTLRSRLKKLGIKKLISSDIV
jgi:transcriptional regulator with GAF, ATPase, and Fis domain